MREYETTFIVQPEISDEGVQELYQRLDAILEGSSVRLLYDDLGRKRLAYEIRKFQKGRYVTLIYLDEGGTVAELERALGLDDSVLRYLTVQTSDRVENIEERKAEAVELERVHAQKAAERAAREAEEAERAQAEEAERARAEEAARARAEEEARAAAEAEGSKLAEAGEESEVPAPAADASDAPDAAADAPEAPDAAADAPDDATDSGDAKDATASADDERKEA